MGSINTNRAAMQALRAANAAGAELRASEKRLATGLKVSGTRDDSAAFIAAQALRGEALGWQAVGAGLSRWRSITDVAIAGTEQIADLVVQLKEKALEFSGGYDPGSKAAIRADMEALIKRIDGIAKGSDYAGINMLESRAALVTTTTSRASLTAASPPPAGLLTRMAALPESATIRTSATRPPAVLPSSPLTPPSFPAVIASVSGGQSINVTADAGPTAGRVDLLFNAVAVPDTLEIWQGGTRVAATGQGYATNGAAVGAGANVSGQHVLSFDYDPARGRNVEFRFNPNGAAPGTFWTLDGLILQDPAQPRPTIPGYTIESVVETATAEDPPLASADPEQAAAADGAPEGQPVGGTASYTLNGGATAGRVDFVFEAFGLPDKVEVFQNGARIAASGQAYAPGGGAVGAGLPVSGSNLISFDYDPTKGPLTFEYNQGAVADPGSAWAVGAIALQPLGSPVPTPTIATASTQAPGLTPIRHDMLTSPAATTTRLTTRDLTAAGLGLGTPNWASPSSLVAAVKRAEALVLDAAAHFGTTARALAGRAQQVANMGDVLARGIGNLVDADMGKEAARLQAAQVRQQLAVQSLGISNGANAWVAGLFGR